MTVIDGTTTTGTTTFTEGQRVRYVTDVNPNNGRNLGPVPNITKGETFTVGRITGSGNIGLTDPAVTGNYAPWRFELVTSEVFEVGQRVRYANDICPESGVDFGSMDHSGFSISKGHEFIITEVRGEMLSLRHVDSAIETPGWCAWRFEAVEVPSEPASETLAEWEVALLSPETVEAESVLTSSEPLTLDRVIVGQVYGLDAEAAELDGAFYCNYPERVEVVSKDAISARVKDVRSVGEGGYEHQQWVSASTLKLLEVTTTEPAELEIVVGGTYRLDPEAGVDYTSSPRLSGAFLQRSRAGIFPERVTLRELSTMYGEDVVAVVPHDDSAPLQYVHKKFLLPLEVTTEVTPEPVAPVELTLAMVRVDGVYALDPIAQKRSRDGGSYAWAVNDVPPAQVKVTAVYGDNDIAVVDAEGRIPNTQSVRLSHLKLITPTEPTTPEPAVTGRRPVMSELVVGQELKLDPEAHTRHYGLRASDTRVVVIDLAGERPYCVPLSENGGRGDVRLSQRDLFLLEDDEEMLRDGGRAFNGTVGEVYAISPETASEHGLGAATRVQLQSYSGSSAYVYGMDQWYVRAVDGGSARSTYVKAKNLLPLPEPTFEHKRDLEKVNEKTVSTLTKMFDKMTLRAEANGLCTQWEKERDSILKMVERELGIKVPVMPAMSNGDVFADQYGRMLFATNAANGYRTHIMIDHRGDTYDKKRFKKELLAGNWKLVLREGKPWTEPSTPEVDTDDDTLD